MLSLRAVLCLFLLTACAASQSTAPDTPWRAELATSGGFSGRGLGNLSIDSDRKLTLTTMTSKSCTFDATAEELATFGRLVGTANAEGWAASYAPENECCDRIEYLLTVDEAGKVGKTRWIDDPKPLPADVTALAQAFAKLRETYAPRCR
ncbi:MAG TPA: hypothetical protein VGF69_04630 [Thermoanaerobaculia bacterium]|jgi:hypothetical protein